MSTNPDINRLSLEERIKRLETRLPSPGAGGNADFFLDPKIVDQCPENAITDVGTGLVLRIDIPNFYDIQSFALGGSTVYPGRIFNNLELKFVRFYPRIQGTILNCFTEMGRAWLKAPITNVPAPRDGSYAMNANLPFDDSVGRDVFFNLMPGITQVGYAGSGCTVGLFSQANGPNVVSFAGISFTCYSFTPTRNYTTYMAVTGARRVNSKNESPTVYPSCSFGISRPVPFSAFPVEGKVYTLGASGDTGAQIGRFTGANPQSLPDIYKPFFPTSWYT